MKTADEDFLGWLTAYLISTRFLSAYVIFGVEAKFNCKD